jgi:hypothetical protein
MAKERILITVKTYPTLSKKYGETVCTAGIREDGSWVRLYPVPFRRLEETEQYSKYDWIELNPVRNTSDCRPESHRPYDPKDMPVVGHIDTNDDWRDRRRLVLETCTVYDRLEPLLKGAKANELSLAVFKPAKVLDFVVEECERDWDAAKVEAMRNQAAQGELFEEDAWRQTFELMPKLPYNFSYQFEDADGRKSTLQVLDWEAGQLFWNCMKRHGNDETTALQKVRQKYMDQFLKTDLHFFLGTMQQFHGFSPNPWVIIGVFPAPYRNQMDLF